MRTRLTKILAIILALVAVGCGSGSSGSEESSSADDVESASATTTEVRPWDVSATADFDQDSADEALAERFPDDRTALEQAVDTCEVMESLYIDFDEAGLFVDGDGDETPGASIEDIACLLTSLEVPNSIISRMEATTSLMGVQEASFRGLRFSWTYHPSNGLDISVVEE